MAWIFLPVKLNKNKAKDNIILPLWKKKQWTQKKDLHNFNKSETK